MGVRISPKGKIVFQMRYYHHKAAKRLDLGSYPSMSLKEAREIHFRLRNEHERLNIDPKILLRQDFNKSEKDENNRELKHVFDQWYKTRESDITPGVYAAQYRTIKKYVYTRFSGEDLNAITLQDWLELLSPLARDKEAMTGILCSNIKRAYEWAIKFELAEKNPLARITKRDLGIRPKSKTRFLSDDEISNVIKALSIQEFKHTDLVKLCLFFGCRLGELRSSQKNHFDIANGVWKVPPENGLVAQERSCNSIL